MLLGDADVDEPVGEALPNGSRPVESGMAAVMATSSGRCLGLLDQRLGERGRVAAGLEADADVVEALDRVVLGGRVAPALLGEHVDDDRAVVLGGVAQRLLQPSMSWPSNGPGVAHAEVLEERRRLEHLAHGGHERRRGPARAGRPTTRDLVEEAVEAGPVAEVGGVEAEAGQALAELRDGGGVASGRCR